MAIKFANLASTTLASGITSSATSLTVASASGFPTLGASDYCYVTIGEGVTSEIVKVTAISGTTFTIVRAQDGTTASAFSSGEVVALRVVAAALDDIASAADTESVSISGDTMTGSLTTPGLTVSGSQTTQLNGSDSTLGSNFDVHLLAGSSGGGVRLGTNSSTNDSFIATTGTNDFKLVTYNGSSWGNRITLDNLGNFGVGQNTPQQILHVSNGGLQIDGYVTTPASGQTGVLIDYYSGASRFWSRGTASARGSFSFIQLENDGQNQQTALGIDTSGNATFAGDVVVGTSSTEKTLRVYFSDGSHATLSGYGLDMNRTSSYVRPTTDGTQTLYLGGADASLDWATVAVKSTNGISMNGSIFIDGSRNLNNIGTISSGAITTTGRFLQQGTFSVSNNTAYFSTYAYGSGQGDNRTHFGYYNSTNSTYTNYIRGTSTLFSHGVTIQGDISTSGSLTLESGTNGTTDKIILKTSDNADLNKFIRTNAYYVEFGGHANEGFKFVDTNSNTLLALYGGNNALAKQAVFAGKVSASTNYSYGGSNYHFILKEDTQDSYIGNINGTVLLTSGGYYYGAALRQMNSGSTSYSALQLHPSGVIEMEQITGATAGGTATRNIRFKIETDGSGLFTGNLKTQGTFHANYSELGRSIRSADRGELHINATGSNDVSEIFFGYGDGYAGNDNKIRWAISDRGVTGDRLVFYQGPGLTGSSFVELFTLRDNRADILGELRLTNRAVANLQITSSGGQNYTQGDIRISSSTIDQASARGQGIFYFNEGQDATWYSGTLYNQGSYWGIGRATGTTLNEAAADVANYKLSLDTSGNMGLTGGVTAAGTFVTSATALLRRNVNSWTTSPTHDVLYNGWTSATGDYVYLKVPGNTADSHGQAFFGDNVFAYGITTMETGAVASNISATAPIDSTWFYANSSGLTVNGDVTANNYNGHKLSNSEWGMTLGTYMTADITGQKISKHTSNSSWNGEVRSTLGLQRSAEARVIPNQTNKYFMFGLNTDPTTNTSYSTIDYAFYCQANGNLSAYENGTSVSLGLTYAAGDDLRVVLEKPYIRYIKNDAVVRTVKAGSSPFATGDETFYFDSSFYNSGNDQTRLIHFGPARTLGLEGRPLEKFNSTGRYFLGNNDWSDIPTAINPSNFAYNAASKGMEVTGGSAQLFIPCRIPIDPDASYRIRVRMMKVSGAGSFYVGVQTLTEDFVNIATDPFNSYNYGVASNATPSVGAETEYEGIFSGYNTTSGGSSTAFDPDGKYFNLYILCNYQGSGTTVIRSVEIERYDPEPLVYGLRKINSDPIVINSNQAASHALRVYYDMSVYNTINFTDSNWSTQGKIDGTSNGLRYFGDSHKFYTKSGGAMYHYSSQSSHYLHSGTGSNDWEIGRDGSQKLRIYVDDHHINLQAHQDDDSNAEHNLVLDRYFGGTGGNNFVVRKDGSNQMYIDTDAIMHYQTFRAFNSDATPAGTVFSNTIKGQGTSRTIYFDGDGSLVSTWYGVGNNPFSAIDSTDGVMDFWINNSAGTWRNIAHVDENGLHVTYGGFYLDNSASIHSGSRISFLNGGAAVGIAVESVYAGTSYSNSAPSGMVGSLNGYQVGNQTIIDSTGSHVGHGTNYATDKGWVRGDPGSTQTGYYGGNFTINGSSTENAIITTDLPGGGVGKVWASYQNDSGSNADGGWNKTIAGLDDESSYISIVYVRRYSSGTSGSFYHGCSGSTTLNMDGSANTNPYFSSFGISNIPYNVWCVSIGFIHGNSAPNSQSYLGGLYNCETGEQISAYYDFKMKDGATTQIHRTYLYYSTGSAYLQWAKPGFYRIDGTEPSIADLIRPNPEYAMRVSDNLVVGRIYGGSYTYMGLRHKDMTGSSDAMIKSTGDHTVVTAKNGYSVKIRGGGDNSSNEILVPDSTYIQVDTDNFNVEGNVNANASSDRRLKHSLRRIENPLDKLRQITGFHFEWDDRHVRKMSGDGQIEFRKDDVGVIAQDVQKVLDECVVERKDGYLGVRYDRLIPLCIEGLKEADAKIQEQQRQIDQLTELVKELTNGNN